MTLNISDASCNEACWYAKEDICRCSCAGTNHGLLLRSGTIRPARQKKFQGIRYTLEAIVIGYGEAHRIARETYGVWRPADRGESVHVQPAPASAFGLPLAGAWKELAGYQPSPFHQRHPYLIWKRT